MNSVSKDLYAVLCAARRSGWTWQSPFWILAFACTVALNCQITSQNACYGCEKRRKSNPIQFCLWRTKISEAVCKRDWHNVRSYLFFNVRIFRTKFRPLVLFNFFFSKSAYNCQIFFLIILHNFNPLKNPQKYWKINNKWYKLWNVYF